MIEYEFDEMIEKCPVCRGLEIKNDLIDHRGISISKCTGCGFQFMNPQYTDRYLSEYYSKYTVGEDFTYWHDALLSGHGFYFSLIERYVRPGTLFDIGCGNGHLMEAAMGRGWSVRGYDVDEKSTQIVAERLGVEVNNGDLFSINPGEGYDLVSMHQVLEHLKDPNRYLNKIRSLIKDDGYLFVAVPNIKSLSNRMKRFLEKRGFRRNRIGKYYDTSHHVLYFEPRTLIRLLESQGFEAVYKRNCYSTRPNQSRLKRLVLRNITDHLCAKSAFLVIAKKCHLPGPS